ncbi:MAG: hypothetical protein A2252_02655 [Elusimicrobia bacterium RIFOXYA2_FULL_39_19]|nr:MAG: hypothetical protein A2252_02655 [Elusimicrobia bacterium RIFOXYA2_FULL_39_19]
MARRVLIAEDEWELRNLLKIFLEKIDFEVMEAEDGKHAFSMASSFKPDLILFDNKLQAIEIIPKLKNTVECVNVPIVMLIDSKIDRETPIKVFIKDFIMKPFDEKNVLSIVKNIFSDLNQGDNPTPKVGGSEKTVVLAPGDLPTSHFGGPRLRNSADMPVTESTVQLPFFKGASKTGDVEKTVVMNPNDLPINPFEQPKPAEVPKAESTIQMNAETFNDLPMSPFKSVPKISDVEKTVVMNPNDLPMNPFERPKPEAPKTESTIQMNSDVFNDLPPSPFKASPKISDVEKTVVMNPNDLPINPFERPKPEAPKTESTIHMNADAFNDLPSSPFKTPEAEKTVVLSPNDLPINPFKAQPRSTDVFSAESTIQMKSDPFKTEDPVQEPQKEDAVEKTVILSPGDLAAFNKENIDSVFENKNPEDTMQFLTKDPAEANAEVSETPQPDTRSEEQPSGDASPFESTMQASVSSLFPQEEQPPVTQPDINLGQTPEFIPEAQDSKSEDSPIAEKTVQFGSADMMKAFSEKLEQRARQALDIPEPTPEPPQEPEEDEDSVKLPDIFIKASAETAKTPEPLYQAPVQIYTQNSAEKAPLTKYYGITGISIKDLIIVFSNGKIIEKRPGADNKTILVIAVGLEMNSQEVNVLTDIFGTTSVFAVDYNVFAGKISELNSLGANIYEFNIDAFKKV